MTTPWSVERLHAVDAIRAAAAEAGGRERAGQLLGSLVEALVASGGIDYTTMQEVVATALMVRDLAAVETVVGLGLPSLRGRISVSIGVQDPPDVHIVRWDLSETGMQHFRLSPFLFARESGWIYMIGTRWVGCLRMAAVAGPALGRAGWIYLDMGDFSSDIGVCFSDNRADALLVPDSSFLSSAGYADARVWGGLVAWADRVPTAIWRGSSTGMSETGFLLKPRVTLCRAAAASGGLIDAGLTALFDGAPEDMQVAREEGLEKGHVPMEEHAQYKFQIDIDGNSNSWPGLFQKLLTGSPVLKVLSPGRYRQWYYARLVPWWNYVPVAEDMSDLVAIVEYLRGHDGLAQLIGERGRALAMSMTMEAEIELAVPTVNAAFDRTAYRFSGRTAPE